MNIHPDTTQRKQHARWQGKGASTDHTGSDNILTTAHRALLRSRGLSDDTMEKARLSSADKDRVAEYLGFNPSQSGGIVIPYIDPMSAHEVIYRVRLDSPVRTNGKEIKYLGAKGIPPRLYFPPGWRSLLQGQSPIIVTE